jgi:hypothetical protein
MFMLDQSPSYWWPVTFTLPAPDGGQHQSHTFDVQLRRKDGEEINKLFERGQKGQINDVNVCRELVVGWRGVQDADGREVVFSTAALERVLRMPNVATAIVRALIDSLADAPKKN